MTPTGRQVAALRRAAALRDILDCRYLAAELRRQADELERLDGGTAIADEARGAAVPGNG